MGLMELTKKSWVALCAAALLAGCSTTGKEAGSGEGVVVEDHSGGGMAGTEGAEALGAAGYGELGMEALNDPASPLAQRTVYFMLDSADVTEDGREVIATHAAFLNGNPSVVVTVEGHCDERGSPEYNIGLGDRRAQAVRRLLEFQGVSPDQISTVSYGEEKPVVEGHDESAWQLNRRGELVY